jgi:hypothetical protein
VHELPGLRQPGARGFGRGGVEAGRDDDGVLEQEELLAVWARGGVRWYAVVGAAPGHEVELPRLPGPRPWPKRLHQRLDRLGRERRAEELRLDVGAAVLVLLVARASLRQVVLQRAIAHVRALR